MNKSLQSPGEAIDCYLTAFSDQDSQTIGRLFGDSGLLELPMVKPSRLVGRDEVSRAHLAIFGTVVEAIFDPDHGTHEQDNNAIWTGNLRVKRTDGSRQHHPMAIVATTSDVGRLERLTLHLDARHFRRWTDSTIL